MSIPRNDESYKDMDWENLHFDEIEVEIEPKPEKEIVIIVVGD